MKRVMLIVAIITVAISSHLCAEEVDLQKFIQETQRLDQGKNALRLVWWIPTEFWKESFKNAPQMTPDQKKAFYKVVDDYVVLCVVDAKTTVMGSIVPISRDKIKSNLSLVIGQEKKMRPLSDSEVSSDARNFFAMMKPVMANMLGQFGQGMEFFCFRGVDSEGKKLLDPKGKGLFSVTLGDSTYKWRLPLGSLLPPKYDLQTGEKFPGNYIYNPFTGKKLALKPPNSAK